MKILKEFLCRKSFEKRSDQAKKTSFIRLQQIANLSKFSENNYRWPSEYNQGYFADWELDAGEKNY